MRLEMTPHLRDSDFDAEVEGWTDQLLVRMYNVGLGDCIYLRVPDQKREVHILIDCGNKFGALDLLRQRIAGAESRSCPDDGGGEKRLDLLVVTHPHEDHHKGFEEEFFQDIKIERIWLSPAFDRENPKAKGFPGPARRGAAGRLRDLSQLALGEMKEQVDELLSLSKDEALRMLNDTLPENNGIQPLYVTAQHRRGEADGLRRSGDQAQGARPDGGYRWTSTWAVRAY